MQILVRIFYFFQYYIRLFRFGSDAKEFVIVQNWHALSDIYPYLTNNRVVIVPDDLYYFFKNVLNIENLIVFNRKNFWLHVFFNRFFRRKKSATFFIPSRCSTYILQLVSLFKQKNYIQMTDFYGFPFFARPLRNSLKKRFLEFLLSEELVYYRNAVAGDLGIRLGSKIHLKRGDRALPTSPIHYSHIMLGFDWDSFGINKEKTAKLLAKKFKGLNVYYKPHPDIQNDDLNKILCLPMLPYNFPLEYFVNKSTRLYYIISSSSAWHNNCENIFDDLVFNCEASKILLKARVLEETNWYTRYLLEAKSGSRQQPP